MSQSNSTSLRSNGQIWGVVDGDTLRIVKTSESHFVKKYRGYGVSPETISKAQADGATWLELVGYDGEQFRLRIADFMLAAIHDNLGSGEQLFLSVKWLRYYTRQYCETVTPSPEYSETQMRMFE